MTGFYMKLSTDLNLVKQETLMIKSFEQSRRHELN